MRVPTVEAARRGACDWLRRGCRQPAEHSVWHRGPLADDVRHVCDTHLIAATALGYQVGTPPPRPCPGPPRGSR
jgi:hypothetical protein